MANLPFTPNPKQDQAQNYLTRRGRPMLFQVLDPTGRPVWDVLLALHVNPQQFDERMQKSKNVTMTYGGFVEFVWPEELDSLSAQSTTGAFMGPNTGLTSGSDGKGDNLLGRDTRIGASGRQHTMAWERQEDLLDLFRSNGQIFNGAGRPVLRGQVMCIYDRGIFKGHFTNFEVEETDEKAFSFQLSWEFKVEETIHVFPTYSNFTPTRRGGGSARVDGQPVQGGSDFSLFGSQTEGLDPNQGVTNFDQNDNVIPPEFPPLPDGAVRNADGTITVNGVTFPPNTVVTVGEDGALRPSIGGEDGDLSTPI